jgi:hypothetical protein
MISSVISDNAEAFGYVEAVISAQQVTQVTAPGSPTEILSERRAKTTPITT